MLRNAQKFSSPMLICKWYVCEKIPKDGDLLSSDKNRLKGAGMGWECTKWEKEKEKESGITLSCKYFQSVKEWRLRRRWILPILVSRTSQAWWCSRRHHTSGVHCLTWRWASIPLVNHHWTHRSVSYLKNNNDSLFDKLQVLSFWTFREWWLMPGSPWNVGLLWS